MAKGPQAVKYKGRKQSTNVEDRRNDPPGYVRFDTVDPSGGDITFRPPHGKTTIMPYSDPEGEYNRARLAKPVRKDYKK